MKFDLKEFKTSKLSSPKYVKPLRITYIQNSKVKNWEAVKTFDSVAILLYSIEKKSFVLVKQFRPPVYLNDKNYLYTYELCAGIVDKNKSLKEIAKEEILEECGYDIKLEKIKKITTFFTNVGISGAKQHLFYAEVSEKEKISDGGGIEDELIELFYLPLNKAKEFIFNESKAKTPGLMFSFCWYFNYKNAS